MLVFGTVAARARSTLLQDDRHRRRHAPRRSARCEVYGLDFASGALGALEALPHVGSVIDGDDAERVQRLLRIARAASSTAARELFADGERGEPHRVPRARRPDEPPHPAADRQLPGVQERLGDRRSARAPFYQVFMRILGEGRPLGIHAVITADRGGAVPTAVRPNISRRVVLRLADPSRVHARSARPKDVLDDHVGARARHRRRATRCRWRCSAARANVAEQTKALDAARRSRCATRACRTSRRSAPCRRGSTLEQLPGQRRRAAGHRHRRGHARAARLRPGRLVHRHRPARSRARPTRSRRWSRRWSASTRTVKLFHFGRPALGAAATSAPGSAAPPDRRTRRTWRPSSPRSSPTSRSPAASWWWSRTSPHLADGPRGPRDRGADAGDQPNSDHLLIGDADVTRAGGGSGVHRRLGRPIARASS